MQNHDFNDELAQFNSLSSVKSEISQETYNLQAHFPEAQRNPATQL